MKLMMVIGLALICISANAAKRIPATQGMTPYQSRVALAGRTSQTASAKTRLPQTASNRTLLTTRTSKFVQPTAQFKGAANVRTSVRGFKGNSKWLLYQNLLQPNQTESDEDDRDYCALCGAY